MVRRRPSVGPQRSGRPVRWAALTAAALITALVVAGLFAACWDRGGGARRAVRRSRPATVSDPAGASRAPRTIATPAPPATSGQPAPTAPVAAAAPGQAGLAAPPVPGDAAAPGIILDPGIDRPDAFVLRTPQGYYLYSSEMFLAPLMVSFSRQLGRWPAPHAAMTVTAPWAMPLITWAPDVRFLDGRYVVYFDSLARPTLRLFGRAANGQCLGTAVSDSPEGPFVPSPGPLVCQFDHDGSIDARTFVDPAGQLWLIWKSDDNADFPDPAAVTHVYSQRLSPDGLALTGPRSELLAADRPWQHRIIESPDLVYTGGIYWLFYSGGWYNQPYYAIGLARCPGPSGPCQEASDSPWLASNSQGQGPGEESLFQDGHGDWWMTYAPWAFEVGSGQGRPVALVRVAFGPSGPYPAETRLPGSARTWN